MSTVGQVIGILEQAYPPHLAASWDAGIGLACGDPDAPVTRVLFAVDAVESVVDEAVATGAQLIVTHHPLLFAGTHSVATTSGKGRIVHRLIRSGIALYSAHTNADNANPGVTDALAARLDVRVEEPIEPIEPGALLGSGRIGRLPSPMTLGDFVAQVAARLPATVQGVRAGGDLTRIVEFVALCGGAGDDLLDAVADRVDVYVTADLRHHPAQDHLTDAGCALIDVAHWASEWPWLEQAAAVLVAGLAERGDTVEAVISTTPTDPWSLRLPAG